MEILNLKYIYPDKLHDVVCEKKLSSQEKTMKHTRIKDGLFLIIIFIFILFGCNNVENSYESNVIRDIHCNLEKVDENGNLFISSDKIYTFQEAFFSSTKESRSGNNSILLSEEHPYGLTIVLNEVKPEEYYEISVWRKGSKKGALVASDPNTDEFYFAERDVVRKDTNDWELIMLDFYIPYTYKGDQMKIYVWVGDTSEVYFDDLTITQKSNKHFLKNNDSVLQLFTTDASYEKICQKRKDALIDGILVSSDDDYVPSLIVFNNDTLKGKIRLKGDWLDHLIGEKWSFRIKLKKKYSWKGMRTFSIHTPKSRFFLHEWLTHKIYTKEDVLATRYGFVNVELNGKPLGVYAYEEHMEKNLLEAKQRREGPILKFSESLFWYVQKINIQKGKRFNIPVVDAARIEPFKENRTLSSPVLSNHFKIANNLMFQYKYGLRGSSEIFDIDKLATYFALNDLTKSRHSLPYHNQRFYYNPVVSKIEPIAFDCYSGSGIFNYPRWHILGNFPDEYVTEEVTWLIYQLFQDSDFVKAYVKALKKYSDLNYILNILDENRQEIQKYQKLIQSEFLSYNFNDSIYIENAKSISDSLPKYIARLKKQNYKIPILKNEIQPYDTIRDSIIHEHYIQCFKEDAVNNKVKLINYTSRRIEVIGEGKDSVLLNNFERSIKVNSINEKNNSTDIIMGLKESQFIFFKYIDKNDIHYVPIVNWSYPTGEHTPAQMLSRNNNVLYTNIKGVVINNGVVEFQQGIIKLNKSIFIPKAYKVIINAGTNIDLINKAVIVSYSPFIIKGMKDNPVKIYSSDGTGMGLNIFCAETISEFNNVVFSQLNTLNFDGWILTGAVNLYESDVKISNTVFKDNRCEDALNIIRSNFTITNCSFDNIFSDAFDSDFCTGSINNCSFRDISNDAIDFSGSKVKISNCSVLNANDKGISGGEDSELEISDCIISYCNLGVAAKDLSKLNVKNCTISNCKYGVAAFNKKPEYGNATLELNNVTMKNINTKFCIEEESTLLLNSEEIVGTEKEVYKIFY